MKTANDERQQWLNSLKVGDEVFVSSRWDSRICTVTKITPTRRFEVSGIPGVKFNSSGREIGGDPWGRNDLEPVTDKIRGQLARNKAVNEIRETKWETLTTQQLLDVLKIISKTTK